MTLGSPHPGAGGWWRIYVEDPKSSVADHAVVEVSFDGTQIRYSGAVSADRAREIATREAHEHGWTNVIVGNTVLVKGYWRIDVHAVPHTMNGDTFVEIAEDGREINWFPGEY